MLIILPTDTCYGLAGEFTEQDYHEIYRLKGRDFGKQLAILVEDYDDMREYIDISERQIEFLKNYPHPWSFLGKKREDFTLPEWMDVEKYQILSIRVASVCLRHREEGSDPGQQKGIPYNDWIAHPSHVSSRFAETRIRGYGSLWSHIVPRNDGTLDFPLYLTSANLSGMSESKTLAEARVYFPGVEGIDGGVCSQPPSDIFSIGEDGELQYLRRNY